MLRRLGYAPELGDPLESSGKLPFILRKSVVELGSIETQCLYSKQWDTWTGLQGNSYDYERIAFDSTSRGLRGLKWIVNVLRRYFSRFDQGKYFISSFFYVSHFLFPLFSNSLGAQHDSAGNPCADVKNIMSTRASGKETAFEWSSCSRRSIHAFLSWVLIPLWY